MNGIDVTEIVRLREFARQVDWYTDRLLAERKVKRVAVLKSLARDARKEADDIERADGLPRRSIK